MSKKVFVSYCHAQADWVRQRLVPCLKAGGAEVIVDYQQFQAGRNLVGQMDQKQDDADLSLLLLSPDYLNSPNCIHEMERAIAKDPQFHYGRVLPVIRAACNLPPAIIQPHQPIWIDLQNDRLADRWELLLQACAADLGATAPDWLAARDEITRYLNRHESVNLVVSGQAKWSELLAHLQEHLNSNHSIQLGIIDMERGSATQLKDLVAEIIKTFGGRTAQIKKNEELVTLDRFFSAVPQKAFLALTHFDMIIHEPYYDVKFFAALRYQVMTAKKVALLIESRDYLTNLLPHDHPISQLDLKTVELRERT